MTEALPHDATTLAKLEAKARALLSKQLWLHGRFEEAAAELDLAIGLAGDGGWKIRRAILMPPVPQSTAQIAALRAESEARLTALLGQDLHLEDPVAQIDWTPFLLSYHGPPCEQTFERLFHQLCAKACPALGWEAPHCRAARLPGRPRVGFISWFFNEHTISRLFTPLIARLDGDSVDITVFAFEDNDAALRRADLAGKRIVILPASLPQAREIMAVAKLDVLIYLDLGMDPFTLFLAHARLAPLQAVLWGHPETTGIPTIDVFLSCDAMEPEDAESHYGERLGAPSRSGDLLSAPGPSPVGAGRRGLWLAR